MLSLLLLNSGRPASVSSRPSGVKPRIRPASPSQATPAPGAASTGAASIGARGTVEEGAEGWVGCEEQASSTPQRQAIASVRPFIDLVLLHRSRRPGSRAEPIKSCRSGVEFVSEFQEPSSCVGRIAKVVHVPQESSALA